MFYIFLVAGKSISIQEELMQMLFFRDVDLSVRTFSKHSRLALYTVNWYFFPLAAQKHVLHQAYFGLLHFSHKNINFNITQGNLMPFI